MTTTTTTPPRYEDGQGNANLMLARLFKRAVPALMTSQEWLTLINDRHVRRNPDVINGILNKREREAQGLAPYVLDTSPGTMPQPPSPTLSLHVAPPPPAPPPPPKPRPPIPLRDQMQRYQADVLALDADNRITYGVALTTRVGPLGGWETSLEVARFERAALEGHGLVTWLAPVLTSPCMRLYTRQDEALDGHRALWADVTIALNTQHSGTQDDASGGMEAVCSRLSTWLKLAGRLVVRHEEMPLTPPLHLVTLHTEKPATTAAKRTPARSRRIAASTA